MHLLLIINIRAKISMGEFSRGFLKMQLFQKIPYRKDLIDVLYRIECAKRFDRKVLLF